MEKDNIREPTKTAGFGTPKSGIKENYIGLAVCRRKDRRLGSTTLPPRNCLESLRDSISLEELLYLGQERGFFVSTTQIFFFHFDIFFGGSDVGMAEYLL